MSARAARGLLLLTCVLGVLLSVRWARAQATVETSISAEQVELGQAFRLRLEGRSSDGSLESPRLRVPPSFVVSGPSVGTQQQITIVNGRMDRSVGTTATWALTPTKLGHFKIGPGSFEDQGKTVSGSIVEIDVVAAGTLPQRSRRRSRFPFDDDPFAQLGPRGSLFDQLFSNEPRSLAPPAPPEYQVATAPDPSAFLRATLEPATAVVGQQVTLRVYAYGALGVFAEGPAKESRHTDFFAIPIVSSSMKQQQYAVDIGGQAFFALKVREIAMFPLKAGELSIGGMTMSFYGQRYATRRQPEGLERSTEPLLVKVTEPPSAGRPAGYQLGDVGDFALEATLSNPQVEVGGAVSVVATLKGTGRLPAALSTPEQKGVEWLEPSLGGDAKSNSDGSVGGSRTFTYVVRLSTPGKVDLGELTLPYYSPTRQRYEVLRSKLGVVEVVGSPAEAKQPEPREKLTDQLSPRRELAKGVSTSRPWFDRAWYYPALLLPPGFVLLLRASRDAFRGVRRRRTQKQSDPRVQARETLKSAAKEIEKGATVAGLTAVERALFLALDAATAVKGRAVMLSDLEKVLTRAGLEPALAKAAATLLEDCQSMRFGDSSLSALSLHRRAEECVRHLAKCRPGPPKA